MILLRRVSRILSLILHTLKGVILTIWHSSEIQDGIPSDKYQAIKLQWLRDINSIINLEVHQHGTPFELPALYVSNHISWLDIPVVGGQVPISFLSKYEVQSWPVIGWLTKQSGTLFIKRGNDGAARQALHEIEQHLTAGQHILIFPEGTTTNGTLVRIFHPRLFAVAIEQGIAVQPVAIEYTDLNGNPSEIVPFVDGMAFIRNLWQILGEPGFLAKVHFLPPITETSSQQRKVLAARTRKLISDALGL